jgi:hypothetical protein
VTSPIFTIHIKIIEESRYFVLSTTSYFLDVTGLSEVWSSVFILKVHFPRTESFPKMSLLKVENFQLQNFLPTKNLCRPITFYKIFFLWKISWVEICLSTVNFAMVCWQERWPELCFISHQVDENQTTVCLITFKSASESVQIQMQISTEVPLFQVFNGMETSR